MPQLVSWRSTAAGQGGARGRLRAALRLVPVSSQNGHHEAVLVASTFCCAPPRAPSPMDRSRKRTCKTPRSRHAAPKGFRFPLARSICRFDSTFVRGPTNLSPLSYGHDPGRSGSRRLRSVAASDPATGSPVSNLPANDSLTASRSESMCSEAMTVSSERTRKLCAPSQSNKRKETE